MKIARFKTRTSGFTLVEIMIVVAILGLLVGIALPNFMKSRSNAQKQICIENISQIESAKQIWGVEGGHTEGDAPEQADLIGPTLYIKRMPECPAGGDYRFNGIGVNAECEIEGHVL
jgi:prepilin-type N-terminal cleavage/methylation domain-containing protein